MDELPINILSMILNRLSLDDKLRCRMISKKFRYLIDNQNQKSLIVAKNKLYIEFRWFDDQIMIDMRNLILYRNNFNLIKLNWFESSFLTNLKKFYFHYDGYRVDRDDKPKNLNFINKFTQLVTLKLIIIYIELKIELKLINLKQIEILLDSNCKLNFLTPKLEYLSTNNFNNLKFEHIETIKHIHTNKDNQNELIRKFINLEQLDLNLIKNKNNLIELITELLELKILCIKIRSIDKEDIDLNEIKLLAKKRSIKIYINELLIDYWNELKILKQNYLLDSDKLRIYLDNYSSIYKIVTIITSLDYNSLESLNSVPPNYLNDKFVNLIRIIINGKVFKQDYLIKLLINCERVKKLEILNSELDQNFYSNLNLYLPIINHLIIIEQNNQLNYDFLFNLKELGTLKLNYHLDLSLIQKLFLNLDYFIQIEFLYDNHFEIILPNYKSKFFKQSNNEQLQQFTNYLTNEYNSKYEFNEKDSIHFMVGNYVDY